MTFFIFLVTLSLSLSSWKNSNPLGISYAHAQETTCPTAQLTEDLRLSLPVLAYPGGMDSVYFKTEFKLQIQDGHLLFELIGYDTATPVAGCDTVPTLASNLTLEIPEFSYGSVSLFASLVPVADSSRLMFEIVNYGILEPTDPDLVDVSIQRHVKITFAEGEEVSTHPLIYQNKLYVLAVKEDEEMMPLTIDGYTLDVPVDNRHLYLYCYDLDDNMTLKWKQLVTDYASTHYNPVHPDDHQTNLIAAMDRIVVISSYMTGEYKDEDQRRMTFYDPLTGDTLLTSGHIYTWPYVNANGDWTERSIANDTSIGMLAEDGGTLIVGQSGFGVSACEGELLFTSPRGHWKMMAEPILMGNILYTMDPEYIALNLNDATAELKGYDVESIKWHLAMPDDAREVSNAVIVDSRFLVTYNRADANFYLGTYDRGDGSLISETLLYTPENPDWPTELDWSRQPVVSGEKMVIALMGRMLIHDLVDRTTKVVEIPLARQSQQRLPYIVSDKYLFMMTRECISKCDVYNEKVFHYYIDKIDLESGQSVGQIDSDLLIDAENFHFTGESLLNNGRWILPLLSDEFFVNFSPPALLSIPLGDVSGEKHQFHYNNQGNCVTHRDKSGSDDDTGDGSTDFPDDGTDPIAPDAVDIATIQEEESLDYDTVLYPDFYTMETLNFAYIPLLERVTFSSDGEPKPVGEGALVLRGNLSCANAASCCPGNKRSMKLNYPYKTYLPLHEEEMMVDGELKKPYLTFRPDMPLYYAPWEAIAYDDTKKMLFSYNAYEHDDEDLLDSITDNLVDLVNLGVSIFTGDICGIITSTLSIGENTLQPEDEGFGSPFVYVVKESGGEGKRFGIGLEERSSTVTISASDKKEGMQTVVGAASDVADLACAGFSVSSLASSGDAAKSLANIGDSSTGRYTEGDISLNRRLMLPTKSLKVSLDSIMNQSSWPIEKLYLRVGVMGEDERANQPAHAVDIDGTPYMSYVRWQETDLPENNPGSELTMDLPIYSGEYFPGEGTAGFYIEIGMEGGYGGFSWPIGVYSETLFLEDILYGGWVQDPSNERIFTKILQRQVHSPFGASELTLSCEVIIEPHTIAVE